MLFFSTRYMLQSASEIHNISASNNDNLSISKMGKRPRSHYSEMSTNQSTSSAGVNKLDTSFESYFGVERSASNSDVVRIKVPYSRDDALNHLKKATSQEADHNKIRIAVPPTSNTSTNTTATTNKIQQSKSSSSNGNQMLEDALHSKLVVTNHHNHNNSKSMTNL